MKLLKTNFNIRLFFNKLQKNYLLIKKKVVK